MRQIPSHRSNVLAQADEFIAEMDDDGHVHVFDGEGVIRLSMPYDVWEAFTRSEYQANLALVPLDRASTVIAPRKELRLPWWQRMLNALLHQRSP